MEYHRQLKKTEQVSDSFFRDQAQGIEDNRPEFAIQRKMIRQIAGNTDVAQRVCAVNVTKQNGSNCGLFCIRMAINALDPANQLTMAEYDAAAERAGSKIGEIFSYSAMAAIVEQLNYHAERLDFANVDELRDKIRQTGDWPVLIAFSNFAYSTSIPKPYSGSHIDTQTGHWSIIMDLDEQNMLTIANPHGIIEKISLDNMFEANSAMNTSPGNTLPQFDWTSSAPGMYHSMSDTKQYILEHVNETHIKRAILQSSPHLTDEVENVYLAMFYRDNLKCMERLRTESTEIDLADIAAESRIGVPVRTQQPRLPDSRSHADMKAQLSELASSLKQQSDWLGIQDMASPIQSPADTAAKSQIGVPVRTQHPRLPDSRSHANMKAQLSELASSLQSLAVTSGQAGLALQWEKIMKLASAGVDPEENLVKTINDLVGKAKMYNAVSIDEPLFESRQDLDLSGYIVKISKQ